MRRIAFALAAALLAIATPTWAADDAANDQQIAQRIADSFKQSGQLKGYSIGVSYKEGVAKLEGWVRNSEQMEKALEITRQAPEVAEVVNDLAVRTDPVVTRAAPGKPQTFQQASIGTPIEDKEEGSPAPAGEINRLGTETPGAGLQTAAYPGAAPRMARNPRQGTMRQNGRAANMQQVDPRMSQQYAAGAPQGQVQGQYAAATQPVVQQFAQPPQQQAPAGAPNRPLPAYIPGTAGGTAPAVYDQPSMPGYAWPSYAAYPNYAQVTYPKQYSPTAWPYIGPFYPYPQVPLGWRKVTLEWDDGWWFLNFQDDRLHMSQEHRVFKHFHCK